MYNGFIYTPPEVIAYEVGKEVRKKKYPDNGGVPKKGKFGLGFIVVALYTAPIWLFLLFLLLINL